MPAVNSVNAGPQYIGEESQLKNKKGDDAAFGDIVSAMLSAVIGAGTLQGQSTQSAATRTSQPNTPAVAKVSNLSASGLVGQAVESPPLEIAGQQGQEGVSGPQTLIEAEKIIAGLTDLKVPSGAKPADIASAIPEPGSTSKGIPGARNSAGENQPGLLLSADIGKIQITIPISANRTMTQTAGPNSADSTMTQTIGAGDSSIPAGSSESDLKITISVSSTPVKVEPGKIPAGPELQVDRKSDSSQEKQPLTPISDAANKQGVLQVLPLSVSNTPKEDSSLNLPEVRTQITQLFQTIARDMPFRQGEKVKAFHVRLVPEHLGSIVIQVSLENNQLNTHIAVENPGVIDLINNQLGYLRDQMANQGLSIAQLDVGLQNNSQQEFQEEPAGNRKQGAPEEGELTAANYDYVLDAGRVIDVLA